MGYKWAPMDWKEPMACRSPQFLTRFFALLLCSASLAVVRPSPSFAQSGEKERDEESPRRIVFMPHFYVLEPIKEEERTLPLPTEPDPAPPAGDAEPEGDGEPDGQPPLTEAEGEGAEVQPDAASTEPREDAPAAAPEEEAPAQQEQLAREDGKKPALAGALDYAANHPSLFTLVSPERFGERLAGRDDLNFEQNLKLARGFSSFGLEKYKALDLDAAIRYLEQARAAYAQIHYEYVAPEEVADVLLYLALSYLEQGDQPTRVVDLFQEMILILPTRDLEPGYYTESVVTAFRDARADLVKEIEQRGLPLVLTERAPEIARLTGADILVFGFVLPRGEDRWRVRVFFWSRETRRVEQSDAMDVPSLDATMLESASNMIMARYADCLREPPEQGTDPIEPARGTSPVSVDLNFSYGTFLQFPQLRSWPYREEDDGTLRHFGNYGVNIGFQWALRREFKVVSRFQLLTSQRDYSGLLAEAGDVLTLRGLIGGELGLRFSRFRGALQIAADFTHLSDFRLRRDLGCGNNCSDLSFDNYTDYDLLFGLNASPSLSYSLYRTVELVAMTSLSYYIASTSASNEVNFPWSSEFGFRYRF